MSDLHDSVIVSDPLFLLSAEKNFVEGSLHPSYTSWMDGSNQEIPIPNRIVDSNGLIAYELDGNSWFKFSGFIFNTSVSHSIEVLVSVDEYTNWSRFFEVFDAPSGAYLNSGLTSSNYFRSIKSNGSSSSYASINTDMDKLIHLVFVYDKENGKHSIYKNGVSQVLAAEGITSNASYNVNLGNLFSSYKIYLGLSTGDQILKAKVSYVAFFDKVIEESVISQRISKISGLGDKYFGEAYLEDYSYPNLKQGNAKWSNKETREQANPYPSKVQKMNQHSGLSLIGKSLNYSSFLDVDGNQRENGYYQSTVLINNVATANRRVMCFTNNGQLVDETVSDSQGKYRFDYLDLNKKYMFVAQYSNEKNNPPDYTAVAADWQSPTPYGE